MRLTFLIEGKDIVCTLTAAGEDKPVRCQVSSLIAVLSGLRYHFAGENALCTLCRQEEAVTIDAQVGNGRSIAGSVPVADYQRAVNQLSLKS